LTVKVLKIVETTKKDEAADMYEIVSETFAQDFRTDSDDANA